MGGTGGRGPIRSFCSDWKKSVKKSIFVVVTGSRSRWAFEKWLCMHYDNLQPRQASIDETLDSTWLFSCEFFFFSTRFSSSRSLLSLWWVEKLRYELGWASERERIESRKKKKSRRRYIYLILSHQSIIRNYPHVLLVVEEFSQPTRVVCGAPKEQLEICCEKSEAAKRERERGKNAKMKCLFLL